MIDQQSRSFNLLLEPFQRPVNLFGNDIICLLTDQHRHKTYPINMELITTTYDY